MQRYAKNAGKEVSRSRKIDHLFRNLEAGMEGVTHHVWSLWNTDTIYNEGWGILLIDTRNEFDDGNCKIIVHAERHV